MTCWAAGPQLNLAAIAPFGLLLAAIAILPLAYGHWWHRNRNKAVIAALISVPLAIYLLFLPGGPNELAHGLEEYVEFIALVGSLYIIAGGIVLVGDLNARPLVNVAFLAGGAVLANVIGTIGASILLIRPLLRTNLDRHNKKHLPVFFIIVVSNCGGLLMPLGPPLFLGFLKGVDFWWGLRLWPQWLLVNGYVLALFYLWDLWAYRRETPRDRSDEAIHIHPLRLFGWALNGPLMLGVIAAVILKKHWPAFPVCELLMLACAGASLIFTPRSVHEANRFTWRPIVEVAVLFAAIFVTMVPVLVLLDQHGKNVPISEPWQFFWLTGLFSSGLDNAPTYMAMAKLAAVGTGCATLSELSAQHVNLLAAVSCGAVFMGANSYIGNGPNFMVKAIAEESDYKMPSFFGYIALVAAILTPIYVAISWLFFV